MGKRRSEADQQVAELLRTAKEAIGLSVAFLSRMDGTVQHLQVVDSSIPLLFPEGARLKQETTFCQAILDGRLPAVIPDVRKHPAAMALPAAKFPRLRSYVSVPVTLSDGTLYGTFCAAGLTTDTGLTLRDKALLGVLASAAAVIIEPGVVEQERRDEITERLVPVLDGRGPVVLLQPIVDLPTGRRVGAEALSRFPAEWGMAPDVVFEQAHSVDLGHRLELLALERAADHLDAVDGYVAMNVSPQTLLTPGFTELLERLPLPRVLLELSEHDQVEDYDALRAVLAGPRAAGMRLAIDDVGAGFSSLRHIVLCAPDVIKLDRSIVDGVSTDPVLSTLVGALVEFAHGNGTLVVAEGVETAQDVEALRGLHVDLAQGWFFGRPGLAADLAPVGLAAVEHAADGFSEDDEQPIAS
ncbi:sensor domain-containing phosphodiesterase [Sanguibacter antarcticus]|uniref:EAL domain-containing protein (Putative c-di-GMP-specific phosphodiesterase class I) n=1 Tax=Sanguibacter antarcticus TaxID=372484 RepID=A0A2A9E8H9_9MICO|nr:EAL domain-containing protein [Sanguibacter antarcticus]PFG34539.1 EAL domain-containing protein (putative c-di-GMP-specific phosphodiesterase class I) [Sanguibacter antarcticus]